MHGSKSFILGATLLGLLTLNPVYANESHTKTNTLTPAEIGTLATIAVIDKNEILVSLVATNKKADSSVNDLAKMMIDQHSSNLTQILEIANQLHALPLKGGLSEKLSADGSEGLAKLGGLEGTQFENAYVEAMVKGHEAALKLFDDSLMKTATSETMKKFLTDTRAVVAEHLEHAKKLQEKMKA